MSDRGAEPAPSLRRLLRPLAVKLAILAVVSAAVVGALGWWAMGMLAGLGGGR